MSTTFVIFCLSSKTMWESGIVKTHGIGGAFAKYITQNQVWEKHSLFDRCSVIFSGEMVDVVVNKTDANDAWKALKEYFAETGADVSLEDLVIAHDDLDIEPYKISTTFRAIGAGTHIPVKGILKYLKSHQPARIKFGPVSDDFESLLTNAQIKEYTGVFDKAKSFIMGLVKSRLSVIKKQTLLEHACISVEQWVAQHRQLLKITTDSLNGPGREIMQSVPPTFVVLPASKVASLRKAVHVICKEIETTFRDSTREDLWKVNKVT